MLKKIWKGDSKKKKKDTIPQKQTCVTKPRPNPDAHGVIAACDAYINCQLISFYTECKIGTDTKLLSVLSPSGYSSSSLPPFSSFEGQLKLSCKIPHYVPSPELPMALSR